MQLATRGLSALAPSAAVLIAVTSAVLASTSPSASPVATVANCAQNVSPGRYACMSIRRADLGFTPSRKYTSANPLATPSGYGPSRLRSAYALTSATAGSGQRVYIIDAYDDPSAESDLRVYRSQYGLPACTSANGCFQKLNQSGQSSPLPRANSGWAGEISLDLDMVSAICPNCGITLIESTDNGNNLYIAVKEATTLGGKFVSMSWGGPENGGESGLDATYFTSSGVVYTASTGDGAYRGGVSYPATSPSVVAVGGTSLTPASNSRGWTETVWKNSSSHGTGSGCSGDESKPPWQSIIASTVCPRRAESDVSAVADPYTGVAVYQSYGGGGWTVYGGTSVAAPVIASVYALAGTPTATQRPASDPYAHTANLFDVTSGNNGSCSQALLCTAAAGWDGPTGLGTPNGTAAFTAGGGSTGNTVTVTNPGSRLDTVGTASSLQISATDSGGASLTYSASGVPTGLTINPSTGLISGTPTTASSFTVSVTAQDTTGASGSTTFTWTISGSGGGGCSGQPVNNQGFESGSAGWAATPYVINTDGTHSRTGVGYAWLDGYGGAHTDTLSQSVSIPAGCDATLSYYMSITSSDRSTTAHDNLILTAGGTAVQTFSNVNQSAGYVLRSVDLSSFAGRTVNLTWTGIEDSSLQTSFFIDDTAISLS